jgi:hypothetical protein
MEDSERERELAGKRPNDVRTPPPHQRPSQGGEFRTGRCRCCPNALDARGVANRAAVAAAVRGGGVSDTEEGSATSRHTYVKDEAVHVRSGSVASASTETRVEGDTARSPPATTTRTAAVATVTLTCGCECSPTTQL